MGRNVASAAGVAVVPPRAADVAGLLQDDEVHTLLLQRDGHTQAGEPGPDDDGAGVHGRRLALGCRLRLSLRVAHSGVRFSRVGSHLGSVFLSGPTNSCVTSGVSRHLFSHPLPADTNTQYPGYRIQGVLS